MLSILEIIKKNTDFFAAKGVENARHDTEMLIGHALGLKRMQLYLQFERLLTEPELAKIRPLARRRAAREPLQYVTGEIEWGGIRLKTDKRALIPRHETELLLEMALEALRTEGTEETQETEGNTEGGVKNAEGDSGAGLKILDLGTGSGALALALAHARPGARVTAVDSSDEALALARENAAVVLRPEAEGGVTSPAVQSGDKSPHSITPAHARVTFLKSNWFAALDPAETFDLIVANPPYLTADELAGAAPEVREHEPRGALVADEAGCADLLRIIGGARARLAEGGVLALETGVAHHATLLAACAAAGFARCESRKDLAGRDRFVLAWR